MRNPICVTIGKKLCGSIKEQCFKNTPINILYRRWRLFADTLWAWLKVWYIWLSRCFYLVACRSIMSLILQITTTSRRIIRIRISTGIHGSKRIKYFSSCWNWNLLCHLVATKPMLKVSRVKQRPKYSWWKERHLKITNTEVSWRLRYWVPGLFLFCFILLLFKSVNQLIIHSSLEILQYLVITNETPEKY